MMLEKKMPVKVNYEKETWKLVVMMLEKKMPDSGTTLERVTSKFEKKTLEKVNGEKKIPDSH